MNKKDNFREGFRLQGVTYAHVKNSNRLFYQTEPYFQNDNVLLKGKKKEI